MPVLQLPLEQVVRMHRARGPRAPRVLQGACLPDGRSAFFAVQSAARGSEGTTYTVSLRGADGSWACACPDGRRHGDAGVALLCKHVVCVVDAAGLDYEGDVWAGGRQRLVGAACTPVSVRAMVERLRVAEPRAAWVAPAWVPPPLPLAAPPAAVPDMEEAPLAEGAEEDDPCPICMLNTSARFVGSGDLVPVQQCGVCRKQSHVPCAAQWVASQRARGVVPACPWCRARVVA